MGVAFRVLAEDVDFRGLAMDALRVDKSEPFESKA